MNYAEQYLVELNERMQDVSTALVEGAAHSFEEYTRLVGVYQGLTLAKNHFEALLQKVEDDDE